MPGCAGLPPPAPGMVISGSLQPGKSRALGKCFARLRIIQKEGFAMLYSTGTARCRRETSLSFAVAAVEMQNNILNYFQVYPRGILTDVRCVGQGCR